jgi:hypothetical protein
MVAIACLLYVTRATATQFALELDAEKAAREAWRAARDLAVVGGALDQQGPVTDRLREIERLRLVAARTPSVDGARVELMLRYADAAVRAAVAAAQDERDEMNVFLGHARGLDRQLTGMRAPAVWPLPIDELEGELFLEVDRYDAAHEAYLRAIANGGGPRAWIGLARANDRLGSTLAACDAYRRASTGALSDDERTEALTYLNSRACLVELKADGNRQPANTRATNTRDVGNFVCRLPDAVCRGYR